MRRELESFKIRGRVGPTPPESSEETETQVEPEKKGP